MLTKNLVYKLLHMFVNNYNGKNSKPTDIKRIFDKLLVPHGNYLKIFIDFFYRLFLFVLEYLQTVLFH